MIKNLSLECSCYQQEQEDKGLICKSQTLLLFLILTLILKWMNKLKIELIELDRNLRLEYIG